MSVRALPAAESPYYSFILFSRFFLRAFFSVPQFRHTNTLTQTNTHKIDQPKYIKNQTYSSLSSECRYETWRGFYKGLGVNIVRVTPATVITFVAYEHISQYLLMRNKR